MGELGGRAGNSYNRKNSTNTDGSNSVCLRTHIGAMSPSGYKGDFWVNGESGEWASCGDVLWGGKRIFYGHIVREKTW